MHWLAHQAKEHSHTSMQEHRRTHADQQAVGWLLVAVAVAGGCGRLLVVGVTKLSLPLKGQYAHCIYQIFAQVMELRFHCNLDVGPMQVQGKNRLT